MVHVIGLGPGGPELLTLKAARLLKEATSIFLLAEQAAPLRGIVQQWADLNHIHELSMGQPTSSSERDKRLNAHAEAMARASECVLVVPGDPALSALLGRLLARLYEADPRLEVELVPAVAPFSAALAALGRPVVAGKERLGITPAGGEVQHAFATFDAVVVLDVAENVEAILRALRVTGRGDEAVYVEHAGLPSQRIVRDVDGLRKAKRLDPSGVLVVSRRNRDGGSLSA